MSAGRNKLELLPSALAPGPHDWCGDLNRKCQMLRRCDPRCDPNVSSSQELMRPHLLVCPLPLDDERLVVLLNGALFGAFFPSIILAVSAN
jgi:hypothetical protein